MLKEKDVIYDNGIFWVCQSEGLFFVLKSGRLSTVDRGFSSLPEAIARCDKKAKILLGSFNAG